MILKNQRIVIVGGSSGIGFATAQLALTYGATVTIASRNLEKLERAQQRLKMAVEIKCVDLCDETSIDTFFGVIGPFDHLQLPASSVLTGPFLEFSTIDAKHTFDSKFWGPYRAIKSAVSYINKNGSITLFSGRLSQRPSKGTVPLAAVNSAVEGLGRALAVELAPIRVNTISPGITKTELFTEKYSEENLKIIFETAASQNIIQRYANPQEIAEAAIYLMRSTYTTGSTLFVDGGNTFR